MTLSYDKRADVLYINFDPLPPDSYMVENEQGDILKLDRVTKRVVGCTIPFFAKRAARGKINIPEIGGVPFNALAEELLFT